MKSKKGITLVSLIFYIIAATIIIGIISMMTAFFYNNTENIGESSNALSQFNIFNLEMVKEAKKEGNRIVEISEDEFRVTFLSGTTFTFKDGSIYKDRAKICSGVSECAFQKGMQEEKEILRVFIWIGDYAKTMEYVVGGISNIDTTIDAEESYTAY